MHTSRWDWILCMTLNPTLSSDGLPLRRYASGSEWPAPFRVGGRGRQPGTVSVESLVHIESAVWFELRADRGAPWSARSALGACDCYHGHGACLLALERMVLVWVPPMPNGWRALDIPLQCLQQVKRARSGWFSGWNRLTATVTPFAGSVFAERPGRLTLECASTGTPEELFSALDRALVLVRGETRQLPASEDGEWARAMPSVLWHRLDGMAPAFWSSGSNRPSRPPHSRPIAYYNPQQPLPWVYIPADR